MGKLKIMCEYGWIKIYSLGTRPRLSVLTLPLGLLYLDNSRWDD